MSGLMSGDWKRTYGANCDTGVSESGRKQSSLATYGHRASRRLYHCTTKRFCNRSYGSFLFNKLLERCDFRFEPRSSFCSSLSHLISKYLWCQLSYITAYP